MQSPRFDLKFAFLLMSNVCVVAWGGATMAFNDEFVAIPVIAVFASVSCALYGLIRRRHPIVQGTVGGFAGVAASTLCLFALHGLGYFFQTSPPDEYFDDGAILELVIFPPICIGVWGGFCALVGAVCGSLVWLSLFLAKKN